MDSITIPLEPEIVDSVVQHALKVAYELNRKVEDDNAEFDVDFLYCLDRVIEYYSSPQDYEAWQESIRE